jgi:enolase
MDPNLVKSWVDVWDELMGVCGTGAVPLEENESEVYGTVTNDVEAERMIKKIQEETAETQRMVNVCDTFISEYQFKKSQEYEALEKKVFFYKQALQLYFEQVPHKKTKTQETYQLPSGKLKLKVKEPEYIRDADTLSEHLAFNDMKKYFETKSIAKWAEIKKDIGTKFIVKGDELVETETGIIVEGVKVVARPDEFEIEI